MIINNEKIQTYMLSKYLSISAFIFFFISMFILAIIPPKSGYEPSIYGAYPLLFWILICVCIILSVFNIVLSTTSSSNYWKFSLLCILLCYSFLLFLPIIRGYQFFGQPTNDLFVHLAHIHEIVDLHHTSDRLYYPITHLLAVALYYLGLPLKFIPNFISLIFLLIYILSLLMLGKIYFKNNPKSLFVLIFGLPLLFSFLHYAFMPYFFALSVVPLFLYCFHNRVSKNKISFRILTLILIFFIVFTHPLVTLFLFIFLILYHSLFFIKQRYVFDTSDHTPIFLSGTIVITLTVLTSFLAWYLNFRKILSMISLVVDALFDQGQDAIIDSQMSIVQSSSASTLEVLEILIKTYGPVFVYLFLASFCFIFILNKLRVKSVSELELFYGFQFIVSLLLGLLIICQYFVISEPIRALSLSILISTIITGIVFGKLHEDISSKRKRYWINSFVIVVVCSSSIMGIFNIYTSPWLKQASPNMNEMTTSGLDWFLVNKNSSVPLVTGFESLHKYESYHSRIAGDQKYNSLEYTLVDDTNIPSHFGYDTNDSLFASLGYHARYMMIYEYMIEKHKYVVESQKFKYSVYLNEDFQKLNNDSTANKLYVNGEFELWNT